MQSGLVWFEERPAGLWNGGKYPGERGGLRVLGGWGRFYGKSTYLKRGYTEENMNTGQKKYSSSFIWAGNTPVSSGMQHFVFWLGSIQMWLLDRNLWYMLKYYRSGCQWSFFSFWWSGTLKTICWTPPVNIDGNITGVEKRKHFAVGVKQTNNKSIWVSSLCFFLLFFFY